MEMAAAEAMLRYTSWTSCCQLVLELMVFGSSDLEASSDFLHFKKVGVLVVWRENGVLSDVELILLME